MRPRDIALATLPPALWAITYVVAKPVTASFPPMLLMSIAYALTALVLFRPWTRMRTSWWVLLAAGSLGGSLQSALVFSGIERVPASLAILVVQAQVPFAVLAAWAIGQERMNARRLAGIVIAISGVAVVVGLPSSIGELGGLLMIVLGTLSWGVAQGIIRAASGDPGARLMGAMSAIAAPQLLAMSLFLESGQGHALAAASLLDWLGVGVLALGGFVAAYSIWYGLLRLYRVDQIAPFALLMPILGVIAAFFILGERPSMPALAGGLVILFGLGLVVRTPKPARA
jgi:O-acetylserine/cysteine efflux transporter